MNKKILVISPFAPYKSVRHAGGQIHYHYVNKMAQENDVTLISFAHINEKADIEKYGVNCRSFISYEKTGFSSFPEFIKKLIVFWWYKNPFNRYGGIVNYQFKLFLFKTLKILEKEKYSPDYILFDWIQASFFIKEVKKIFPDSKVFSVEQDVVYLNFYRRKQNARNILDKIYYSIRFNIVKKNEIRALSLADEVLVLNYKDMNLLKADAPALSSIRVVSPYYHSFIEKKYIGANKNIIFYGAMNRMENHEAVVWFIENVFNKLDTSFKFIIIGNAPSNELLKYKSDRIQVLGFVEDVTPYFSESLCLVVPLIIGAGIKIKVLEGLSAGIPVLTNDIGIEGISARNGVDYLHCWSSQDYIDGIYKLASDKFFSMSISDNAKKFILKNFNFKNDNYILK